MKAFVILCNVLALAFFFMKRNLIPPQIPLFYSKQTGEDQLAEWWMLFLILILMNSMTLLNFFVFRTFFSRNEFVKKMILFLNAFSVVLFTLIFIKIILLVT